MKTINTNKLTGAALDWAVAKCEHPNLVWGSSIGIHHASHQIVIPHLPEPQCYWNPSTDWAQGGPIIEREGITTICWNKNPDQWGARLWLKLNGPTSVHFYGPTPLIAAMRCHVATKLGDTVEVPDELL